MTPTTAYLVDDEPEMLELLGEVVESAGLKAQGYTRASRFFEQVTVIGPGSVLVLDLQMPGMDGIEVMRRVARLSHPPALILISGADDGVLHAAGTLGRVHGLEILAALNKPLAIGQFQRLLEQYASRPAGNRQPSIRGVESAFTSGELHHAIRDDQLSLHYQPQIDMATGALAGVEALVRWQHPEQGLIYPDRFIPLAERHDLMGELTHWVIEATVHRKRHWRDAGLRMPVAVNISAVNIVNLDLPEQIAALLASDQLDPTLLTLEVTESALMGRLSTSLDILTRLRLKGIGLSIDDFGTGHSSLSQLHRVPFSELKIDRSFVSTMVEDPEARAIVKTCILLSHELEMRVVAEGVEDQRAWDMLVDLGCDVAQGYFIAKPMPQGELFDWAANRKHPNHTAQSGPSP